MQHHIDTVDVNGSPMEIFMYAPDGDGPFPGLTIAQHIPVAHAGIETDPFTLKVCERYAENGYAVACPFIFHWWPKEEEMSVKRDEFRDDWTVLDMKATYDHLASQPNVDSSRIGTVGHCWGGRVTWLDLCHNPDYKAGVIFYGGRVKIPLGPETKTAPIDLTGNIKSAMCCIFGKNDQGPSPEDAKDYEDAMKKAGIDYECHHYDGAGHGFQDFTNADRFAEEQSEDAWNKSLAFLKKHLS